MGDQFQLQFDQETIGVIEKITKKTITVDLVLAEYKKTKKVLEEISKEEDDWGYELKSPTVGAIKAKAELDRLNKIL